MVTRDGAATVLMLALDTSGDVCSIALCDGPRELSTYLFRHEMHLAERLPGYVEAVLRGHGHVLREVEAFAVGLGPGSFTGVRVGVTMAKMWAHVLARPLFGISSLDALAEQFLNTGICDVVAVAPTRRTEVVAAFYPEGKRIPVEAPEVVPHTEVLERARRHFDGSGFSTVICGEAAPAVMEASGGSRINVGVSAAPVSAAAVARLARARIGAGESDDPFTLVPLYITPTPVG